MIDDLIAKAMDKVVHDGIINGDKSNGFDNELEISKGTQYDKGYVSPDMVSNCEKMQVESKSPYILVTSYKINNIQEILSILKWVLQANKPLFFIAITIHRVLSGNL